MKSFDKQVMVEKWESLLNKLGHTFRKLKYIKILIITMQCTDFSLAVKIEKKHHMSRLMGKPTICICENKGADQLRGNREADQRLCFRYTDSAFSLLLKSEISNF